MNWKLKKQVIKTSVFLAAILLVFTNCLAQAPVKDGWAQIEKDLTKSFRGKDVLQQYKNLDILIDQDHTQSAAFIIDVVTKRRNTVGVKMRAAEILSGYKSEEARKFLATYLEKEPRCDIIMFDAISKMGIPDTKNVFTDILINPPTKKFKCYYPIALKAMGGFPKHDDKIIALLIQKLDEKEPLQIRRAACEALGGISSIPGMKALIPYVIDPLIYEQAVASLVRLTGQDFSREKQKWQNWVQEQGGDLKLANLSAGDYNKLMEEKEKARQENGEGEIQNQNASFYGIKLNGKKVFFILDRSGSMQEKDAIYGTRIDRLKKELGLLLSEMGGMPFVKSFGMSFFSGIINFPQNGTCQNDKGNITDAQKFIKSIMADGGTPMKAMIENFMDKIMVKYEIDTVYLLSDGEPTDATCDEIVDMIRINNLGHYVIFNTISIGTDSVMLKKIAEMTGGKYVMAN